MKKIKFYFNLLLTTYALRLIPYALSLISVSSFSQGVAINTSGTIANSSAILDASSTTQGLLIPRMTEAQKTAIVSPATGLLIYQTNGSIGFWYFNGTIWVQITATTASDGWLTTGNSGTTPGTNFIGTLDAKDFVTKTNGSAANNERMRVTSGGKIVINKTTAATNDVFSVYGTGTTGAINPLGSVAIAGYSFLNNIGVLGDNSGTGAGVFGNSVGNGFGVRGNNNSTGWGVAGVNSSTGTGVYGSNNSSGFGVVGVNSGTGLGVLGQSAGPIGLLGTTTFNDNVSAGVFGSCDDLLGTGTCGAGNNIPSCNISRSGSGVSGTGEVIGVFGSANSLSANVLRAGGYFASGSDGEPDPTFSQYAYVGAIDASNVPRKIEGIGTVNTVVKDLNGNLVTLTCPEAPEILFEDYGSGELINGEAHISIDPVFTKNIIVNEKHPLRVFVQLEGECNGVYITNKTASNFDVKELRSGKSNTKFMWHIVANRANEKLLNGTIAPYAEQRFSKAIPPQKTGVLKVAKSAMKSIEN